MGFYLIINNIVNSSDKTRQSHGIFLKITNCFLRHLKIEVEYGTKMQSRRGIQETLVEGLPDTAELTRTIHPGSGVNFVHPHSVITSTFVIGISSTVLSRMHSLSNFNILTLYVKITILT